MKRYLIIMSVFWQRALTYRFTVFGYRIGESLELVILIVMWTAIFQNATVIGSMTLKEMITYLLVGNLFRVMVRNFLSDAVARDIKEGQLSLSLVKPMGYFTYIMTKEIGRISVATLLSAISQVIVCAIFFNSLIFNLDPLYLLLILVMLILAFFTELLLSYLIGLIAFWTDEVDGIYSSIDSLKRFFSGGYFPLSLLPQSFVTLSFLLPFAYSFYVPTQLYLRKIDLTTGLKGVTVQLIWIGVLSLIIKFVWTRGLKNYEGVGI